MNVAYQIQNEMHFVCIDDDLESVAEIAKHAKSAIAELHPEVADSKWLACWVADGVLTSLADERGDIELGPFPDQMRGSASRA